MSKILACLLAWPAASTHAQDMAGRVTDTLSGEPLPGAQVLVERAGARIGLGLTDSGGFFSVSLLGMRGTQVVVRVRRIGYRVASRAVSFDSAMVVPSLQIALERVPVELEEIVVLARRMERRLRHAGFYDRARTGFGHFVTDLEIRARDPRLLTDALRMVPGLSVTPSRRRLGAYEVYVPRAQGRLAGGPCPPRMFLDGFETGTDFDDYLRPEEVASIEVYRGPAETPAQFGGAEADCGVIVIWTK